MEQKEETMTVAEVAKRLRKNRQYVRELIKVGKVPWGEFTQSKGIYNYLIVKGRFEKWMAGEI